MKHLSEFDKLSFDTKLILFVISIVALFIIYKIINYIFLLANSKSPLKSLSKLIIALVNVIKDSELKTIAGIINLLLSIVCLIITVGIFIGNSIPELLGFDNNFPIIKVIFLLLTPLSFLASVWMLYRFQKQYDLVSK